MIKAYKYRIYPNEEQKELINKNIGCSNFVYNYFLRKRIDSYNLVINEKKQIFLSDKNNKDKFDKEYSIEKDKIISNDKLSEKDKEFKIKYLEDNILKKYINPLIKGDSRILNNNDCSRMIPEMKKEKDFEWLKEVNSKQIIASLRNLDTAYQKFFKRLSGFPKFKKKQTIGSFQQPQEIKVDFKNGTFSIGKIKNVKCIFHRKFVGDIGTTTVLRDSEGNYFVSFLVKNKKENQLKKEICTETSIGIDLGIKSFLTDSNGNKIENQTYYKKEENRLKKLDKRLSKRQKDSNNYKKLKNKISKIEGKIKRRRDYYQHVISKQYINNYDTIIMEDLDVKNMMKKPDKIFEGGKYLNNGASKKSVLNKFLSDVALGSFKQKLQYKAEFNGKNIILVDKYYPSSKLCNYCGHINEISLNDRIIICGNCNKEYDRDLNAAKNILNKGLENMLTKVK